MRLALLPLLFHLPTLTPSLDEKNLLVISVPLRIVGSSLREADSLIRLSTSLPHTTWLRAIAQHWKGRPYGSGGQGLQAHQLLINLQQMDCMTAVENLLALSLAAQWYQKGLLPSKEAFIQALLRVRYHTYPPCRWEDRYHYLSHAFLAWENDGWGTRPPFDSLDTRSLRYISQHRHKYKGFSDWSYIYALEKTLTQSPRYWIPETDLAQWLPLLHDGDIIAFIPSDSLLDVSHVGVFFWEGDKATFAHASLTVRQWVYGEDLCAYLDRRDKVIGITVFRPSLPL